MNLILLFLLFNCPIESYQNELERIPLHKLQSGLEVIALTNSLMNTQCQSSEQQVSIFLIFDKFYKRYSDAQTDHFYDHYVPSYYRDKYSTKSKKYADSLRSAGLALVLSSTEEMYVSYSPAIYLKYFANSNSKPLNSYVDLLLTEKDIGEGYVGDYSILVNRLKKWETSLLSTQHPDLIQKNLYHFKYYTRLFMNGLDNTRIYKIKPDNSSKGEMLPEFQQIVLNLTKDKSHPLIYRLFNSFHEELSKHNYEYFDGIRTFYSEVTIKEYLQIIK